MLNFLSRKKENHISDINSRLTLTFDKANEEISLLKQWISHLHIRNKDLEESHKQHVYLAKEDIHNVNRWVEYLQKHNEDLKDDVKELNSNIIDIHKNHKEVIERIARLEEKSLVRGSVRTESAPENESVSEPIRRTKFEDSIISQIRSNRKNYVMMQILDMTEKENLSTKQIENIVVHEKNLCGRTAFYSYLKELKDRKEIKPDKKGSKRVLATVKQ